MFLGYIIIIIYVSNAQSTFTSFRYVYFVIIAELFLTEACYVILLQVNLCFDWLQAIHFQF